MSDIIDRIRRVEAEIVIMLAAGDRLESQLCEAAKERDSLRLAIRRLAEQDATLSVVGGNVIVEMDATLTDAEREAVEFAVKALGEIFEERVELAGSEHPACGFGIKCGKHSDTLAGLLERHGTGDTPPPHATPPQGSVQGEGSFRDSRNAGEPLAWAVMVGGERMYVSWSKEMCEDEAYYHRHPCGDSVSVVPLYRQPQDGVVRLPKLDPNGAPGWNAAIGAVTSGEEETMTEPKDNAEPSGASGGYGFVAALIQTDSSGKVAGIRHQERDSFPPNELIPLYLCPQLTVSKKEQQAIKIAIEWLTTLSSRRREIHSADLLLQDARTLSGLLQRIRQA